MADYIVETERLTKCYGDRLSVSELDLRVPEGSVYGFLGPNGAGKTTTMKLLLGLAKPTGGTIRLMGRELNEQNRLALLRETGSLIESPSCYGHLTAQENLEIAAEAEGCGCRLPAMPDEELARLVRRIADSGAGLVEVNRQTKSLEDIFLSLTGEGAA